MTVEEQNRWLVTMAVGFGSLMGSIDSSIVNVALPQIRGSIGATVQEVTWISTSYIIAMVIVMPLTAFLGRLLGQKRLYLFCLGLFLFSSLLCGFSNSLITLAICRFMQGLGAGVMMPTQQAILRQTFPPKEQGMAMAIFGMVIMLGPAVGLLLGGWIVNNLHWSWIFFVNLPVGVIGVIMVILFMHEDPDLIKRNQKQAETERRNIDWAGISLLSIGLATLVYFLEEGSSHDWFESPIIIACCAICSFTLIAFIIRELTAPAPVVDLSLFKDRSFASSTLLGFVMYLILMASMLLLPIFMQEMMGYDALKAGITNLPRILIMVVALPIVGKTYLKIGPRIMMGLGTIIYFIGAVGQWHFTLQSSTLDLIVSNAVQGIGFACLFVPLTTVSLSTIPRHRIADATGLNSLVRQIGGAIGMAVCATMLSNNAMIAKAVLQTHITEVNPFVIQRIAVIQGALTARDIDPMSANKAALKYLQGIVTSQGMLISFDGLFLLCGILILTLIPFLFLMKIDRKALVAESHVDE